MRRPPKQIAIPSSAEAVSDEVAKLLRAAGVSSQLPTPRLEILGYANLVEVGEIDLDDYKVGIREKALGCLRSGLKKVLGFLDRRTETIYVDPKISHDSRKLFVTYHEVTHKILPWQNVRFAADDSQSLSPECTNLFEGEANFGAAEIMFQGRRFETEARDYEISIASALALADAYQSSCHSALRRFVERNHRPCLLLVLRSTDRRNLNGDRSYFLNYAIPSSGFVSEFGDVFETKFAIPDDLLRRILNNGHGGDLTLTDLKGFAVRCNVETYTNGFNFFALIHPRIATRAARISARFRPSVRLASISDIVAEFRERSNLGPL